LLPGFGYRGRILGHNWNNSFRSFPPCYLKSPLITDPPPPPSKKGLKLVCNVNFLYRNLKSENYQDYTQKHRVHILVEMKQGQCICPLSWSVHSNFSGEGKCNERGWACTPHPHQPGQILPSSLNVRQKAAVATLCTLCPETSRKLYVHEFGFRTHTNCFPCCSFFDFYTVQNFSKYRTYSKVLTIYAPVIYTRPCIMFWRRGYTLCGEVGRCWALEFPSFLGPVKWQRADRRVPFGGV
jgi:hypothetical protein